MRAPYSLAATFLVAASAHAARQPQKLSGTEINQRQSCPGPISGPPKTWWRAEIDHNGTTPSSTDPAFQYYRNVLLYGADNTGVKDSSRAFNDAVNG